MAEEAKKPEGEDENLNSDKQPNDGDGGDQKPTWGEKTTFTLEEVNKMKADSERWVQKVLKEKAIAEKMLDAVPKISDDPMYLVNLSDEEPDVANAILKKFYDWKNIEEYMEEQGITLDMSDPVIAKKRIESEARKLADSRLISEKKEDFIKEFEMTPEEKEAFNEALSERMELKSFRVSDLRKHMEKAYMELDSDSEGRKKLEQQAAIGKALSTGAWKDATTKPSDTPEKKSRSEARAFLDKFNL